MFKYKIESLEHYPDNGKHQCCVTNYPFDITKGEDAFYYTNEYGKHTKYKDYNSSRVNQNWIVFVTKSASPSLKLIFQPKKGKNLSKILKYCEKMYIKSLKMEISRLKIKLKLLS